MRTMKHWALAVMTAAALGLAGCGGGGSSSSGGPGTTTQQTPAELATAADTALTEAKALVDALTNESSNADVKAAEDKVKAAQTAVAAASAADNIAALSKRLGALEQSLMNKKTSRTAAMDEQRMTDTAMMAVTATKLYAGISAPTGDAASPAAADRAAAYNSDATAVLVSVGLPADAPAAVTLSAVKGAAGMVDDNHGWKGKKYADPAGGDMYEAVVYSNVEDPTQGKKFGSTDAVTDTGAYQYQLTLTQGALELLNANTAFVPANVAFTGVTRTAGTETFKLPDPNDVTQSRIRIPGSYHGVSGNYYCTPATPASGCSAAVASSGFTVSSGDTWTFRPSSAEARVMESEDAAYASYGWWLHKTENGKTYTASAFVDEKGTVDAASGLSALNGKAIYMGGAAGKYALSSSTGGTNDAGHFTARATLEANFTTNTAETAISGTIDNFMGADGMARDWSVKLNGSQIGDTGEIGNASASTGVDTVWTIDGKAAAKSGNWTGTLRNNGADLVPQVATGTFYTEYGRSGRMVGAFGVTKQ